MNFFVFGSVKINKDIINVIIFNIFKIFFSFSFTIYCYTKKNWGRYITEGGH